MNTGIGRAFENIMIDMETTGMDAKTSGILSLAAIPFDILTSTIETHPGYFYQECNPMLPLLGRRWNHETLNWHLENTNLVDRESLDAFEKNNSVREMLLMFTEFVANNCIGGVKLWSRPSHFDYPILQSHLAQFEADDEFVNDSVYSAPLVHYRNVRDVSTWCEAVNPAFRREDVVFNGAKHHALDDTRFNLSCMMHALATMNEPPTAR